VRGKEGEDEERILIIAVDRDDSSSMSSYQKCFEWTTITPTNTTTPTTTTTTTTSDSSK